MSAAAATVAGMELQVGAQAERRGLDTESRAWLTALHGDSESRRVAVDRLHELLLRAARFEAARRRGMAPFLLGGELEEIVAESAADALLAVLARLDDYRGASRFTTWAYKFALLETAVKFRRRAWQGRELPRGIDGWKNVPDPTLSPTAAAEQHELLAAIRSAMATALTPHQREVLVAIVLNEVPIDVLAERLGTTRGALYKTVHDSRRRLRAALTATGFDVTARSMGGS